MAIYIWPPLVVAAALLTLINARRAICRRRLERGRELTAQQLLDMVVANSSDAMIHESLAGTILGWNTAAERMFGVPSSQALGRRMSAVIPPERIADEDVILASLSAGIRLRDFETTVTRADGRTVFVSVTVAPIRNHAGATVGTWRTMRDISDRKRLERSLQRLAIDADLLRHSRLELRKERIELAATIERAIDIVDVTTSHRPRTLQVTQLGDPVHLHADPIRIEQVLCTLLTNASRFTSTGGHIWLDVQRSECHVEISVRDDGAGMDAEYVAKVLDADFNRAVPPDAPLNAVHLGLPLTRAIIEMHGGTITAHSAGRGKGSTFTIVLPIAPVDRPRPAQHVH